jgi:putative membrane protein
MLPLARWLPRSISAGAVQTPFPGTQLARASAIPPEEPVMRPLFTALALTAVLSAPVLAQDKMSNDDASAMKQVAQANLNEISAGKTGVEKAQSPDVKQFAQKMIDEHSRMLEEMKALAKRKDVALPQDANMKDMAQMKLMERKSGADFDREFMEHMVKEHEKTLKDVQNIAAKAKDAEFKAALQKATPKIKEHLELAQRISKSAAAGSSSK